MRVPRSPWPLPNIVHLPTLTGHAATTGEERELGVLLRWGYGSAFGLWHGALRRTIGEPWASAVFGATLMSATLSLFPLLGRTPPPWRWRTDQLLTSFGTHAVYVTTIALVDAALSLHDRDRGTVSRPAATLRAESSEAGDPLRARRGERCWRPQWR